MKTKLSERELVQWDPELVIRTTYLLYLQLIQDYTSLVPWQNLSYVEGSLPYPSYPRRAAFSYISLQNLVNRLH